MQAKETHVCMCSNAKQAEVEARLSGKEKWCQNKRRMVVRGRMKQICAALPWDTGCRNKAIEREGERERGGEQSGNRGGVWASRRKNMSFPVCYNPTPLRLSREWNAPPCSGLCCCAELHRAWQNQLDRKRRKTLGRWHAVDRPVIIQSNQHHRRGETKPRPRRYGASVKAGESEGEARWRRRREEGKGGREGGRRLEHEEGRLTDIAAVAFSSYKHISRGRPRQSGLCTLAALSLFSVEPRTPSLSSYSSSSKRIERRTTRRRRRRKGGSNHLLSCSQTHSRERERAAKP